MDGEEKSEELSFEIWVSFRVVAAIIGVLGNLLTLISVLYARKKRKHGLHNTTGLSSTIFILNLAMVDLIYCLVIISKLLYGLFIYQKFSVGNESMCEFYVLGIHALATIDGWSIALVAFSHAFPRISERTKENWKQVCSGKRQYFIIAFIWLTSILLYLPAVNEEDVIFEPGKGLEQGYICYPKENGTKSNGKVWFTEVQYTTSLANDVMIFLILSASYLTIWFTFKKEVKLKIEGHPFDELARLRVNIKAQFLERRMIFTIGIICAYYVLLRFPIFYYGRTPISVMSFGLGCCIILHQLQFCLHFVVYAIIHESYRNAYIDILKIFLPCCLHRERKTMIEPTDGTDRTCKRSNTIRIPKAVRFSVEDQLDVN